MKLQRISAQSIDGAEVSSSLSRTDYRPFDTEFQAWVHLPDDDFIWQGAEIRLLRSGASVGVMPIGSLLGLGGARARDLVDGQAGVVSRAVILRML